jgi:uncharacterized protein YqjF (DUF2071 family)
MTNVTMRGLPRLPGVSAFAELNVRTYVRAGGKPGVYFFSLDAASRMAVRAARRLFHLPYFYADMRVHTADGVVTYTSRRAGGPRVPSAEFQATYRPAGRPARPRDGTLEHFLTERYCLHTTDGRGRVTTVDIHHPPWSLQSATAAIELNTMVRAAGLRLPASPPLLHFSRRQDAVAWFRE